MGGAPEMIDEGLNLDIVKGGDGAERVKLHRISAHTKQGEASGNKTRG